MQILVRFLCMVFLIDLLTYPYQKSFQKKSVLKIFIILFKQDCPEAVVHGLAYKKAYLPVKHQFAFLRLYVPLKSLTLHSDHCPLCEGSL